MKELKFNTEEEAKGAQLLMDNLCVKARVNCCLGRSGKTVLTDMPDEYIQMIIHHKHWPYIGRVGQFESLHEFVVNEAAEIFDNAEDIDQAVLDIHSAIQQKIKL